MEWIAVSLVLLLLLLFFFYRSSARRPHERVRVPPANQAIVAKPAPLPKYWGKQLIVPIPERACQAAQAQAGKCFPGSRPPALPLPGCTVQCTCHFDPVSERRSGKERRTGKDRRGDLRFDAGPDRRSGNDRRKGRRIDWNETS